MWSLSTPAIPLLGDVISNTVSPFLGRLLGPLAIKASFSPAPVPERFSSFPVGLALRPSQVRATAADTALMVPSATEISRRYGALAVPIIVMAGEGDIITRMGPQAERFAREVPGAELRVVWGQGHLFHYAVPEQVDAAIEDVVRRGGAEISASAHTGESG